MCVFPTRRDSPSSSKYNTLLSITDLLRIYPELPRFTTVVFFYLLIKIYWVFEYLDSILNCKVERYQKGNYSFVENS